MSHFAQHVLAYPAGKIGTQAGPVLSAGDSIRITLHGKGAHGSMPQNSVDTVVLAALVVLRLQTIVSRETKPGEFAVLTVGSSVAGSKSNIIPDRAVLLVKSANLRYGRTSTDDRQHRANGHGRMRCVGLAAAAGIRVLRPISAYRERSR